MSEQPSKIIPNTFQTPNALVDDAVMAVLSGNETKCYLVIVRKTFGWHKQSDRIAKSQIMQATGLGETAVDGCMDTLVEFGLVLRLAENNPKENFGVLWGLQTDDNLIDWDKLHERADRLTKIQASRIEKARAARGGGVDHQPQVGEQAQGGVDHQPPQKPLSKAIKKDIQSAQKPNFEGLKPTEYGSIPEIKLFISATRWIPGSFVLETVYDFVHAGLSEEKIRIAFQEWCARGYKPANVKGYLEWARDGIPTGGSYANNPKNNLPRMSKDKPVVKQNSPTDADRAAAERVKKLRDMRREPMVSG